jgi:hypothetical protein
MNALTKVITVFLLLLTLTAAQAHQPSLIGFCPSPPYEITTLAATDETQNTTLHHIVLSDNDNELLLKTDDLDTEDLMYLLQNAKGLVVQSNHIESNQTVINMTDLAPATYFLVVSNDRVSKTFKIVKKEEIDGVITMNE